MEHAAPSHGARSPAGRQDMAFAPAWDGPTTASSVSGGAPFTPLGGEGALLRRATVHAWAPRTVRRSARRSRRGAPRGGAYSAPCGPLAWLALVALPPPRFLRHSRPSVATGV